MVAKPETDAIREMPTMPIRLRQALLKACPVSGGLSRHMMRSRTEDRSLRQDPGREKPGCEQSQFRGEAELRLRPSADVESACVLSIHPARPSISKGSVTTIARTIKTPCVKCSARTLTAEFSVWLVSHRSSSDRTAKSLMLA